MKTIEGYNTDNVQYQKMRVLAQVETQGDNAGGYPSLETFGVAETDTGTLCLFRGSLDNTYGCETIFFGANGKDISSILIELAQELK